MVLHGVVFFWAENLLRVVAAMVLPLGLLDA
jgi:hypothetical protein